MPHDHHIQKTASTMAMEKSVPFHLIDMLWLTGNVYCLVVKKCTSIVIPGQDLNRGYRKTCPSIGSHVYRLLYCCTVHDIFQYEFKNIDVVFHNSRNRYKRKIMHTKRPCVNDWFQINMSIFSMRTITLRHYQIGKEIINLFVNNFYKMNIPVHNLLLEFCTVRTLI